MTIEPEKNEEVQSEISSDTSNSNDLEDKWLIRECSVYKDEYSECTSLRGRFHQYFIWGDTLNCHQWKKDYDNCCKFCDNGDVAAAGRVITSERNRRMERLRGHYGNTVWKRRTSPPSDWDRPLPAWLVERDKNTYLDIKAKELRGEIEPVPDPHKYCTIM